MISRHVKFTIMPMIALAMIGFTLAAASAQSETPPSTPTAEKECASCHPDHYAAWHVGRHGDIQAGIMRQQEMNCAGCHKEWPNITSDNQTGSSQEIQPSQQQDGKPPLCLSCHATGYDPATGDIEAYGVTCESCHGDLLADHPSGKMPVNSSQELCQKCHTESRFNWTSWKSSIHFQASMKCSTCHDPHTAKLKLVDEATDPSVMCITCHKNQSSDSRHSVHAKEGVSCVGCHLGPRTGKDDFHQLPDHSFVPSLETCNACHANQMHDAGEAVRPAEPAGLVVSPTDTITPEPLITPIPLTTTSTPAPANPLGFIVMFGIVGLVGGVLVRGNIKKR